jgi:pilus assembly protein CpaE
MRTFIAGDNELINEKIREAAVHHGYECTLADISPLDDAAERAGKARHNLVVVVLSSAPAKAVQVIRDIRDTTHVPILAIGPTDDSTLILRVLREGADEYVGETELASQGHKAIIRLKSRQRPDEASGTTISLVSPCGGSGTSTLAASLTATLAKRHQKAALFDMRLGVADQQVLLDLNPTHTLAEVCRNASRMDANMLEQALVKHSTGIHLLSAPVETNRVAEVTPGGVRKALFLARGLFPFTVLDMDRNYAFDQATGLVQSDQVLLVLRLDMTSLAGATRLVDRLGELGISEERIRVIASRHGQAKELSATKIEQALGLPVSNFIPEDAARVNRCNNRGTPVVVEYPRAKISKSIAALAHDLEKSVEAVQPSAESQTHETAAAWTSTAAAW